MRVLKCSDQFVDGSRDVFVQREAWETVVVGGGTYGFALANTACVRAPDIKTAVVFWGASDVPSF